MRKTLVIAALAAIMGFPAMAEDSLLSKGRNSGPIDITADSLEVSQNEKTAIFTGNVVAKQGAMTLKSRRMIVHYRDKSKGKDAIEKIEVEGGVVITTAEETARGRRGSYDTDRETVLLSGGVVLTKGNNVLKGSALEFNIATGKSRMINSGKERVRGLFVPEEKR